MTVSKAVPRELAGALDTAVQQSLAYLRAADPDAAAELDEMRHRRVTRPSVVLVGETKRGKSSLQVDEVLVAARVLTPADDGQETP